MSLKSPMGAVTESRPARVYVRGRLKALIQARPQHAHRFLEERPVPEVQNLLNQQLLEMMLGSTDPELRKFALRFTRHQPHESSQGKSAERNTKAV